MLHRVLDRLRSTRSKIIDRTVARATFRRRLFAESLEERRLMAVVNGSFESGDFSGWNTSIAVGGAVSVVNSYGAQPGGSPVYSPISGSGFALLSGGAADVYTSISQPITVSAGQAISGWAFYDTQDYSPFTDDGVVSLLLTSPSTVTTLFSASTTTVGNYGQTPWTRWTYTFPVAGTYNIVAAVRNTLDGAASPRLGIDNVELTNMLPTAEANGPYTVNEGGAVTLSSASSNDTDGSISSYQWDLNYNGSTFDVDSTIVSPSFSAAAIDGPATRTVALRVIDNLGAVSAIDTATITINNVNPTATFSNGGAVSEGSIGGVSFSSQFDPSTGDSAFRYAFDFDNNGAFDLGDGTYAGSAASNSVTVPATYLVDGIGNRVVRGRIIDKDGGFTDYTTTITINNVAPLSNAGVDQTVNEGTSVTLNGLFSDVGLDDGHKQEWSVVASNGQVITGLTIDNLAGDNNGSGGSSFSFIPADNGTYTVNFSVTDDDGGVRSDSAVITVNNVVPQLTLSGATSVDEGDAFILTLGNVIDPGTDTVSQYVIHWGDGQTTTLNASDLPADRTVSHIYVEGPAQPAITVDLVDEDRVLQGTVSVDSSFGTAGITTTDLTTSSDDYGYAVAIDPLTGKHVVFANSAGGWLFVRYEADGTLDTSFGTAGRKTFDSAVTPNNGNLAIDSQGRLLVGGYSYSVTSQDFAVARYNPDGTLDTTFGTGGKTLIDFTGPPYFDYAIGIAVDNQDRVLITGYIYNGSNYDLGVARLNSAGQLDNSFGGDGKVTTVFGTGSYEYGYSVAVDSITGNVVVFGQTDVGWTFVRYDDSGALDTGFGIAGKFAYDNVLNPAGTGDMLEFDAQGRMLVSGYVYSGTNWDFAVARYLADGNRDATFGNSGTAIVDFGPANAFAFGIAADVQSRIVLVGYVSNFANGTRDDIGLARLTTSNAYVNIATLDIAVNNVAPIANAGGDQIVDEGDQVTLIGAFTDPGVDDGHSQEWSVVASNGQLIAGLAVSNLVGDSNGSGTSNFSFIAAENGTYTVQFKVTDDDGGVRIDTAVITVNNAVPAITSLATNSAVTNEDGSVTISGSFTDAGTLDTHTVQINWGNGEVSSAAVVVQGNGSGTFTATHQYLDDNPTGTASDNYTITAIVTDDDGGVSASSTVGITVNNVVPVFDSVSGPLSAVLVRDINAGAASSSPILWTELDGKLFLSADDGVAGRELWSTNASTQGTSLVSDILPDTSNGLTTFASYTLLNGTLYFAADGGSVGSGTELWKSDGTAVGTQLAADIRAGNASSPLGLTVLGNSIVFSAFDLPEPGRELYVSDGTQAGTGLLKEIWVDNQTSSPFDGSFPTDFTVLGNIAFFTAENADFGRELWKTDGTTAGTVLVKDISPGASSSEPNSLKVFDGKLFFAARDANGEELWVSDGTAAGTTMVKDIRIGSGSGDPNRLTVAGNKLYFVAQSTSGNDELWMTDGTAAGTSVVKEIALGSNPSSPSNLTALGGILYWTATASGSNNELYRTDGTVAGTFMVADINPGPNGAQPLGLFAFDGKLYFAANDGVNGRELWESDGTAAGTKLNSDINPGAASSSPTGFAILDDTLMFIADDGVHGIELWKLAESSGISIDEGNTFSASGSVSDVGSLDTWTAIVNYGDGSGDLPLVINGNGSYSLNHTYLDNGVYTVSIRVADDDMSGNFTSGIEGGDFVEKEILVTVNNVAPVITSLNLDSTVITENGIAVVNGSFADVGMLDTHTVMIDWGDGSSSAATVDPVARTFTASHQYLDDAPTATTSDVYSIGITLTDDDTGTVSATTTVTVNNVSPVIVSFNAPVINEDGTATISGSFTDVGSLDTHTVMINWGDGSSSPATVDAAARTFTASHQYLDDAPAATASDVYSIGITLTDDDTGSVSATTTVTVNNVAPVIALFNAPVINENGTATISGSFTDIGSLDSHTVMIDWGDGTSSSATIDAAASTFTASHQYLDDAPTATASDVYSIGITVTDDDTGSVSATTTVTVNNVAPVIVSYDAPVINEDGTATISGSFTDVGLLDTHSVMINWGDGSSSPATVDVAARTFTASHQYLDDAPTATASDVYSIGITLTDDDTGSVSAATTVMVNNAAPVIVLYNAPEIDEGGTATISGSFTDVGSLDTHTVMINWGDGSSSAATIDATARTFTASHQYLDDAPTATASDVYSIGITLTDDDTGSVSATTTVTVNNVALVIVSFNAPVINEDGTATIIGSFTDVGSLDTHTVIIDWGDGSSSAATIDATARTFTASHQYLDDAPTATPSDVYSIGITLTDDDTGSVSATTTVTVNNVAPVIVSFNAPVINEDGTATIIGSFTDVGSLDTHTVMIDWGDGTSSLATIDAAARTFTASHQYLDDAPTATASDVYSISITLTDDDTGTVSATTTVAVNNVAPVIVSYNAPVINEDGTATIIGSFTDVGSLDTHTVIIDWGDGSSSAATIDATARTFTASHQYLDDAPTATPSDVYSIGITLTDDDTGTVSAATTVTVNNVAPVIVSFNAPVINEDGTATIIGSFTDVGSLDTHTVLIDWGDGSSSPATVDAVARTFTASHQYLDDAPTATASAVYSIGITLTDDDTGSVSATTTVTVNNVAPIIVSYNAPVINEDGTATISGSFTDVGSLDTHSVMINWGDGTSSLATVDAAARTFTASHQYLDDAPTATASDVYSIGITVTDDDTGSVSATTTVTVNNVAPVITSLTNTSSQIAMSGTGQTVNVNGIFTDIGSLDTHTALINWGDGTTTAASVVEAGGNGSLSGSHSYSAGGIYTVTVTLRDDDGGLATETTTTIIVGVGLVGNTLYIIGSSSSDHLEIELDGGYSNPRLEVELDLGSGGGRDIERSYPLSQVQNIVILMAGGNDHVEIDDDVEVPAYIDGGTGNDHLEAGSGDSTMIGGDGNDKLEGGDGNDWMDGGEGNDQMEGGKGNDIMYGGAGNDQMDGDGGNDILLGGAGLDDLDGGSGMDLLIGGLGADKLNAGSDGDILIGGTTSHDANEVALVAILAEWESTRSYSARLSNIRGTGTGARNNANYFLNSTTVLNDSAADKLTGSSGLDWFWATVGQDQDDKKSNETRN